MASDKQRKSGNPPRAPRGYQWVLVKKEPRRCSHPGCLGAPWWCMEEWYQDMYPDPRDRPYWHGPQPEKVSKIGARCGKFTCKEKAEAHRKRTGHRIERGEGK